MVERVHRTKDKAPLFERFGVENEIASTLDRRVDLPSGGYLIFDYAEAFTVVDVNTGRFVGSRSKSSTQRLEDTATKNNLEAVKEVVRQLRLRDIGGIIVIDFIDMANPKNRQAVEDAFRTELERDRTKTYVVEISPLGLVEMTRQNVTDGPREIMTRAVPDLRGRRDRRLRRDERAPDRAAPPCARGCGRGLAHPGVQGRAPSRAPSRSSPARVARGSPRSRSPRAAGSTSCPAEGHVHADHFEVSPRAGATTWRRRRRSRKGPSWRSSSSRSTSTTVRTRSGRSTASTWSWPTRRSSSGRSGRSSIGRVLEGRAFATLVDTDDGAAPITFESEAEKPTRAPTRRKAADAPVDADAPADEAERVDDEPELERDGRGGVTRPTTWTRAEDVDAEAVGVNGEPVARTQADAPRLPWWQAAQEVAGERRRGRDGDGRRGRGRGRRPRPTPRPWQSPSRRPSPRLSSPRRLPRRAARRAPKIHVPDDGRRAGGCARRRRRGRRRGSARRGDRGRHGLRGRRAVGGRRADAGTQADAAWLARRSEPRRKPAANGDGAPSEAAGEAQSPRRATTRPSRSGRRTRRRPAGAEDRPTARALGAASTRASPSRPTATSRCPSGSRTSTGGHEPGRARWRPDLRYNPAARGRLPAFSSSGDPSMSYAIISVGGKQYRVSAGERLLVDRLALEDGATFTPPVLLVGGDGEPQIAPSGRRRDREGRRAGEGPEDPHRQVQAAHRLQAPHGLPRLAHADRDRVDRRRGRATAGAARSEARRAGADERRRTAAAGSRTATPSSPSPR